MTNHEVEQFGVHLMLDGYGARTNRQQGQKRALFLKMGRHFKLRATDFWAK